MKWTLDEAAFGSPDRPLLDALRDAWDRLERSAGAEILKQNRLRTVASIELGSLLPAARGRWVIKKYRHLRAIDRLRHHFFSSHARREFRALQALHRSGLPVPRPLAFGLRFRSGLLAEGGLVMEEVPGACELPACLAALARREAGGSGGDAPAGGATFEALLVEAGSLVRRLHERGFYHPDLHAGNFLLEGGPRGRLYLIDLHSCRFLSFVPRRLRARGLGMLAHSLADFLPRETFRLVVAGYLSSGGAAAREASSPAAEGNAPSSTLGAGWLEEHRESVARFHARVDRHIERLENRRRLSRTRRCVVESSAFAIERGRGAVVYRRRSVPRPRIDAAIAAARGGDGACAAAGARRLKASPRGAVTWVPLPDGDVVVKHRRYSLAAGLRFFCVRHPLRRAWIGLHGFAVRGLPAPQGLALVEARRFGVLRHAWLVQEALAGEALTVCLWRRYGHARRGRGAVARARFELAREAGTLLRRVHEAGVSMHDFSPQNIMVSGDMVSGDRSPYAAAPYAAALFVVDHDDVRFRRSVRLARRRRNLVQLGNLPEGHVSTCDLLRGLRAYDRGEGVLATKESIRRLREDILEEALRSLVRWTRKEFPARGDAGAGAMFE